nr:MAG TPA: hypothetical protein [Caudoviricetes sp.]
MACPALCRKIYGGDKILAALYTGIRRRKIYGFVHWHKAPKFRLLKN